MIFEYCEKPEDEYTLSGKEVGYMTECGEAVMYGGVK